jgi:hypothetical protein
MTALKEIEQTTGSHKGYEVDWSDWLALRGYQTSDIQSVIWTVTPALGPTYTLLSGAKAQAFFNSVGARKRYHVVCKIVMPPPNAGGMAVTDEYAFDILGRVA